MRDTLFTPEEYFDLADVSFSDIFDTCVHVWDALPRIEDYIAGQFERGIIKPNYKDSSNIFIGEGTTIEPHVVINGPAIIGRNCTISHGAYFRGGVLLGDNVHIGHGSEVKHSILMNGSAVAHLNVVLDSIFGKRVNFSGGAVTANYRFDKQPVTIKHAGAVYETGLSKCGALIGDDSNIGVNSVLNPGTVLGKKTIVYPLKVITGMHPALSVLK